MNALGTIVTGVETDTVDAPKKAVATTVVARNAAVPLQIAATNTPIAVTKRSC